MKSLTFQSSEICVSDKTLTLHALLPIEAISVLTQVRKSMNVEEDLIPSIHEHGQQNPGIAAALMEDEAEQYLEQVNAIWKSSHRLNNLQMVILDKVQYFIFLVAGHRRHYACKILNQRILQRSCEESSEYNGNYLVDLRFGLSAKEAIEIQFNENRHSPVPPHEEAKAAWDFYRWLQQENSDLSTVEFGRRIGRTSEWVRNALRFCSLPQSIQDYVDGKNGKVRLPYGILTNLARLSEKMSELMEEKFHEEAYHFWIHRVVIDQLSVAKFGKMVSEYLATKKQEHEGQYSLFGSVDSVTDDRPLRRVAAKSLIFSLWSMLNYLEILEKIRVQGGFGDESHMSPERDPDVLDSYSPGSPLRLFTKLVERMQELHPHLVKLSIQEGGRHRSKLVEGENMLKEVGVLSRKLLKFEFESKIKP